jgi:hypothetical protein
MELLSLSYSEPKDGSMLRRDVIWDQRESGQIRRTFRFRVVTNL